MARIRTIKPEFWEDEVVGTLSRDARLLFVACLNLADDEGLLRWSAPYIKSSAFMYDEDIGIPDTQKLMDELVSSGMFHSYRAGKAQQPFAYVVGFHKHQKINRPSPSRLPPPPLNSADTADMYKRRDGGRCHLCKGEIDNHAGGNGDFLISLDHLEPVSKGGLDYPSNIRAAHQTCNKGRGNRSVDDYQNLLIAGKTTAQFRNPERFTECFSEIVSERVTERPPVEQGTRKGTRTKEHGMDREGIVADAPASGEGDDLDLPANLARGEEAEAVKTYNRVAEQFGWSECQKLTGSRKAKIRARLRDCGGLGGWSVAMTKAGESKFLRGEGKRGRGHENWKPDLDFFLSEEKFTQLMEGKYDDRTGPHDNGSLERDVLAGVGIEPGMEGVRRPAA